MPPPLPVDIELSKLDEKLLRILAWQRLQQLHPKTLSPKKGMLSDMMVAAGKLPPTKRLISCTIHFGWLSCITQCAHRPNDCKMSGILTQLQ